MQSIQAATQILQGIYPPGLPLISPPPEVQPLTSEVQSMIPDTFDLSEVVAITAVVPMADLFEGLEPLEPEKTLESPVVSNSWSTDHKICSICDIAIQKPGVNNTTQIYNGFFKTKICQLHYRKIKKFREVVPESEFIDLSISEDLFATPTQKAKRLYEKIEKIYDQNTIEETPHQQKSSKRKNEKLHQILSSEESLAKLERHLKWKREMESRAEKVAQKNLICPLCDKKIEKRIHYNSLYRVTICEMDYNRLRRISKISPTVQSLIEDARKLTSSTPKESAKKLFNELKLKYKGQF